MKPKMKRKSKGRKTLLNAKLQRKICGLLAQGHTASAVCGAVEIGERTFYEWREKHPHFSQAVTRAIGQSKIALVDKVRESDDWRAQAFLLERRWPTEFGKQSCVIIQPSAAPMTKRQRITAQRRHASTTPSSRLVTSENRGAAVGAWPKWRRRTRDSRV